MKQFCENDKSFMTIPSKKLQNIGTFLSFAHVYVPVVGSVTIANGPIYWS